MINKLERLRWIMKKYVFTYYNYKSQELSTDFVMAENEIEAKQIAVLIMQFWVGKEYGDANIESIDELKDDYFYTMDKIKEKYFNNGKEFILPEIEEDNEED